MRRQTRASREYQRVKDRMRFDNAAISIIVSEKRNGEAHWCPAASEFHLPGRHIRPCVKISANGHV
jgi:hypothetical protein